jgi:hypothetical protein
MGTKIFDQYTLLHFATGVIAYFWGISFPFFFILHTLFELVENTKQGMNFINNYFPHWPGGKPQANTIVNRIGDTIGAVIGWFTSYFLDKYSTIHHFYI